MDVKKIHESGIYGCFIEMGCGLAVTNKLMEVAGASNTIFAAEAPYSKEMQHKKYPRTVGYRAVSHEMLHAVMKNWIPNDHHCEPSGFLIRSIDGINYWRCYGDDNAYRVNTVYAATFQIGDETNSVSTHGWIGVWMNNKLFFYHVSIHEAMTRKEYLSRIGDIGLEIIWSLHDGKKIPADCCIDMVVDEHGRQVEMFEMFEMLTRSNEENFLTIIDGKLSRLENLFRDMKDVYARNNSVTLFKGSFNPPHVAHITATEVAEKIITENTATSKTVMMIAMEVYQKGWIEPYDMYNRVTMLNALGYPVIVTRSGYFNENVKHLRKKFKDINICFIVGTDTANRIIDSSYLIAGQMEKFQCSIEQLEKRPDMYAKQVIREIENFKRDFKDVMFVVIERGGDYKVTPEIKEWLKPFFKICSDSIIKMSSTFIREKMSEGKLDEVKDMLPEQVFELLVNLHKQNKIIGKLLNKNKTS